MPQAGNSTQVPPLSSGPQISSVEASNEIGASCRNTVCASSGVKWLPRTRRTMPRCGIATPLGVPVEPDVYMTYASSSAVPTGSSGGSGATSSALAPRTPASVTVWPAWLGSCGRLAGSVSTTRGATSSSMKRRRCAGYAGSSGTYAARASSTASIATTVWTVRPMNRPTASPGATPRATSSRASAVASRASAS